jgi:hypothetical protein
MVSLQLSAASPPPTTHCLRLPLPRASFSPPCWLAQRCVPHAPPPPPPAMPRASRYASRMAHHLPTVGASCMAAISGLSPFPLNHLADPMRDTALRLDMLLCRQRRLGLEEQRPARRSHALRRRLDGLVLAPLRTPRRCHDPRRRRVSAPQITRPDGHELTTCLHSLHPTQYPWEHEKWAKTFDHGAYVSPALPHLSTPPNLPQSPPWLPGLPRGLRLVPLHLACPLPRRRRQIHDGR